MSVQRCVWKPIALLVVMLAFACRDERTIVRTADVKITVADTATAVGAITQTVEANGGYVSGSHLWREGELLRAKLTMHVPSDKLTSTLTAIRSVANRIDDERIAVCVARASGPP